MAGLVPVQLDSGRQSLHNELVTSVSTRIRALLAAGVFLCALPAPASAVRVVRYPSVSDMMTEMVPQSTMAALAIRDIYRPFLDSLVLSDYTQIQTAIANGGLVPLPPDPLRFNVMLRLDGSNPIGEKDLANQASYLTARPAAIGCLLDLAARVKSGPVEVTSLVRHSDYQDALRATNWNATTQVPTHTMGIAFDVAIVNSPLATVAEIRDVLRQMSEAGDILVIGERHQLVFHVVPHPSRFGHYAEVYARALREGPGFTVPIEWEYALTPSAIAEVAALRPTEAFAAEWWAAENVPVDVAIEVRPEAVRDLPAPRALPEPAPPDFRGGRYLDFFGGLLTSAWERVSKIFATSNGVVTSS
jgi:hypothetical protein